MQKQHLVTQENSSDRQERLYKVIRERISLLHYPPGTVLGESELAVEFDVSRTPIRRVLQRLHHEGMVEIRNGVGTLVTDVDLKTMKEIYDLRMHLAELMGELAVTQIDARQIKIMSKLLARAKALHKKRRGDYEGYARICNDLEDVLLSIIDSAPLREVTDLFYYRVSRIWFTYLPHLDWPDITASLQIEISEMLDAMKRDDRRGIGQIRRIHLHGILTQISKYLTRDSDTLTNHPNEN